MSLPFFSQETRVSCTVACLRIVLAHWGIVCDEATLRDGCKTTLMGTSASDAVACARGHGLLADAIIGAKWSDMTAWLQDETYPIALLNLFPLRALWVKHAVVVKEVDEEAVAYLDPIYGQQKAVRSSFDQAWAMNRYRAILVKGRLPAEKDSR